MSSKDSENKKDMNLKTDILLSLQSLKGTMLDGQEKKVRFG